MEIFKDIKEYENHYQISNYGRVKSLIRKDLISHGTRNKECFLKLDISIRGYSRVTLCKEGKTKRYLVHRLVGKHFLINTYNKPCINHIDHNPRNNYFNNLEWVTEKENTEHSSKHGRQDNCRELGMLAASKKNQIEAEIKFKDLLNTSFVSTYTVKKNNNTKRYVVSKCKNCNTNFIFRSDQIPKNVIHSCMCKICYKCFNQDEDIV